MIEETGRVMQVQGETAWVETQPAATCSGCSSKAGCAANLLSRVLGRRRNRVRVLNPVRAGAGDRVVIGVREDALVRGSLLMYLVPLAGLLAGAILGQYAAGSEFLSILFAAVGFGGGLALVHCFGRYMPGDAHYQATVLRRIAE